MEIHSPKQFVHAQRPTFGVLAGWQFYRTATNLSYLTPLFKGISHAAQTLGCNVLLGCGLGPSASPDDPFRPAWPFPASQQDFVPIGAWNTDALIIATPLHSAERSAYLQEVRASGLPVVFIGSGEQGTTITTNNAKGIFDALQHLVAHGHRQIAFIAGSPDDPLGDSGKRLQAFRTGCAEFGLPYQPALVVYGRHVYDGGFDAVQQMLATHLPFTAIIASNDESALGAMTALQQAGFRIPQDIAIIGFDNRLEGSVSNPGLTSLHVPLFNMGSRAVELLHQHLTHHLPLPDRLEVNAHLVVRQSCGCGMVGNETQLASGGQEMPQSLAQQIAAQIQSQVFGLDESECLLLAQSVAQAYTASPAEFLAALNHALQYTAARGDDSHIWQTALSLLEQTATPASAKSLIPTARIAVSAHMQQQRRLHVLEERWKASRLSLLTARLFTTLDEGQIYQTLEKHLPDFNIETAWVGIFESETVPPFAWCQLRNALKNSQPLLRFPSQAFPPAGLLPSDRPFWLTLIPLMDPSGQIGFMAFDTKQLNLYGAIVQQLGGALNKARLYRQATEARRIAEDANRLKTRFLSTISHELRTPLNLIVGLSGFVLQESDEGQTPLPENIRKDIERVHAYAQHLGGLIGDVIDLASSNMGKLRLHSEWVDLGQTLRLVAESGRQLALDKGLRWSADIPASGPWVWGDRTRLRQVALNLVNNAVKFTQRGEVNLTVQTQRGQVIVSVRDTGWGVPVAEQEQIFEEFHRSERSVSEGYSGLGLGLAICKTWVELHGGKIYLYSSGVEGEGATFSFTLPEVQVGQAPAQPEPLKLATPGKNLLLLHEAPEPSATLAQHLQQQGVQLQSVAMNQPEDWQARLIRSHPDIIVLSITHASRLAWQTMKRIKEIQSAQDIPVMLYAASEQGDALLNLNFVSKPVAPESLIHVIDQYWAMANPAQTARTFLVVDDDVNTLEMHARIVRLQSASNRVLMARNGREALNLLLQEKVDLVLLDLQMPEMDGFAMLDEMRSAAWTHDIPVIVVTGKDLNAAEMARLDEGVAVVLQKGLFTADETAAHIGAALERKRRLSVDAQRLVRQALLFIQEHYAEPISRGDIARHISIAEDYLTFCFRRELNTTPIKFLQRYRINQAKLLLKNTSNSITAIALTVGFSDSGYFSRIFHRETGLSPEAFRHE
ncbi:MAG TPA: substrate-binding domain-containing protein [Anaerolineales bacterium]|nr:substrate-binding domain-containing protein [Anaerolineales bacterium]